MKMKTLNVIYICRIGFGILAALVATLVVDLGAGDPLINGITIGLAVYMVTYYLLKWQFANKVERPTKILTMGIGIYFLTFIMCWVLFITPFLATPTAAFMVDTQNPVVGETITFDGTLSDDTDGEIEKWLWHFGDVDGTTSENVTPTHTYTSAGDYLVTLSVTDNHGISSSSSMTLKVVASS
jgi:PKD repeat protein